MIIDTAFSDDVEDDLIPEELKKRWRKLILEIINLIYVIPNLLKKLHFRVIIQLNTMFGRIGYDN